MGFRLTDATVNQARFAIEHAQFLVLPAQSVHVLRKTLVNTLSNRLAQA
jgi:hypothetical protein